MSYEYLLSAGNSAEQNIEINPGQRLVRRKHLGYAALATADSDSDSSPNQSPSIELSQNPQLSRKQRATAWITVYAVARIVATGERNLPKQRISRQADQLDRYRPNSAAFPNTRIADSLFHPIDHLARTLVWSDVITSQLPPEQQQSIDRRVVRTAAVLHDVGRGRPTLNPHTHGAIAASLIRDRTVLRKLLPQAETDTLRDDQVENIAYMVEKHHQFDHNAGSIREDMELPLSILQTADGLDLVRGNFLLGGPVSLLTDRTSIIDDVIPIVKHTLRFPEAQKLRTIASRYASKTQREIIGFSADRFTTSLDVAEAMHIIDP